MEFGGGDVAKEHIAKGVNWHLVCHPWRCTQAGWSTQAQWSGVGLDLGSGGHPRLDSAFNKGTRASSWPGNSSRIPTAACSSNQTTQQGSWNCGLLLRPQQELGSFWVRSCWCPCPGMGINFRFTVANNRGAHQSIFWWEGGRTAGRTMQ
jgi:hypothetical protein